MKPFSSKKLNSYAWFVFFPSHIFFAFALLQFQTNLRGFLTIFVLWSLISGLGLGVGFHRLLSHRSFETNSFWKIVTSYLGCLAIQGSPVFWVNVHRGYHHPQADTPGDIQSPIHGKLWSYFLWTLFVDYKSLDFKHTRYLLRSKAQRIFHYGYFFVVWGTWLAAFFISPQFFYALIIAQIISLHQEFCVSLFCHSGNGYRNFEISDSSVNRYWFGLLFWGVGYHNNHHARPQEFNFAYERFEIDPTVIFVHMIRKKK